MIEVAGAVRFAALLAWIAVVIRGTLVVAAVPHEFAHVVVAWVYDLDPVVAWDIEWWPFPEVGATVHTSPNWREAPPNAAIAVAVAPAAFIPALYVVAANLPPAVTESTAWVQVGVVAFFAALMWACVPSRGDRVVIERSLSFRGVSREALLARRANHAAFEGVVTA